MKQKTLDLACCNHAVEGKTVKFEVPHTGACSGTGRGQQRPRVDLEAP